MRTVGEVTQSLGAGSSAVEPNTQLVVALTAAELVVRELEDLGFRVSEPYESDETLGLALLEFAGLEAWTAPEHCRVGLSADRDPTQLDLLLRYLRNHFAEHCGGWIPALAKNRIVGGIGAGEPAVIRVGPHAYSLGPQDAGRHCRIAILDTRLSNQPDLLGKVL